MRTKLFIFVLLLVAYIPIKAQVVLPGITESHALRLAKKEFEGRDVDYFILDDSTLNQWKIFVDAEPMKGWEHECYLLTIPKRSIYDNIPVTKELLKIPPSGNYIPLEVKDRYGTNSNAKPIVPKVSQPNYDNSVAGRTYAIILSGGIEPMANNERYWNDCSFIYQTLVNKYYIPKENVYPMMSDGTDPAADMRLSSGVLVSQPLDLDFDGVNDIKLSATLSNV